MAKNYNDIYTAIYTNKNKMDFTNAMIRGNGIPLDASSVYNSFEAAQAYVNSNPVAYEGQVLAVTENNDTTVYVIAARLGTDGTTVEHYLKKVGTAPIGDDKSIVVAENGTVSIKGFNALTAAEDDYLPRVKWIEEVPASGEEGAEDYVPAIPAHAEIEWVAISAIVQGDGNTKTKVTSTDNSVIIEETKDEENDTITYDLSITHPDIPEYAIKADERTEDSTETKYHLTKDGNNVDVEIVVPDAYDDTALANRVSTLETTKANSADVYNKTEADNLLNAKANSADVYNKSEVYTKIETDTAIGAAVAAADHLKRIILDSPSSEETAEDVINQWLEENELISVADQYIYMIPTGLAYDDNKYYEYIIIVDGENKYIEQVGNWEVDLSDYVSETELATYLKDYYKQEQVDNLLKAYTTTAVLETKLEKYYTIEQISALLENYYTEEEINNLISNYYTQEQVDSQFENYYNKDSVDELFVAQEKDKSLVSDTEIAKLATVKENAEENFIKSVTERFNVSENGQLSFNSLGVNDIEGLNAALNDKVNKVIYNVPVYDENGNPIYEEDGITQKTEQIEGTLLSPEDKEKLAALVIGDEGIQVSGKVNADNVEGLATWITNNRTTVPGLLSSEDETKLDSIEANAQKNFITAIEESQFTVTDGKLAFTSTFNQQISNLTEESNLHSTRIINLENILNGYIDEDNNQVEGLVSIVNNFANTYVSLSDFNSTVGDLNQMKSKGVNLWNDIQAIQTALQWQIMTEE